MIHFPKLVFLLASLSLASWVPCTLALNVLVGSDLMQPLMATQYLNVSTFSLVMQPDCNFILYNGSQSVLSTNTTCTPGSELGQCSLTMDSDGNVYINEVGGPRTNFSPISTSVWSYYWNAGSPRPLYPYMILRDDGTCKFYDFNGNPLLSDYPLLTPYTPLPAPNATYVPPDIVYPFPPALVWKPNTSLDGFPYMPAEYFLAQGSKLQTVDQGFVLELRRDCNLQSKVALANGSVSVLWESGTGNSEIQDCQLMLQQDGRLQIRSDVSGEVYWSSTAVGNVSFSWILKLDSVSGSLSICDIEDASVVLWTNLNPSQAKSVIQASRKSNKTKLWIVVGGLGGAAIIAIASLAILYFYARASILKPEKDFRRRVQNNGSKSHVLFSLAKIKEATNNFEKKIGHGGFGDVFYGKLADGQEVAAKVLSNNSYHMLQEFYNEIELLSVVHHKYLVSLLGYSFSRKYQTLVYEYVGGGDLRYRLQGDDAARNPLTWKQRTDITLQVAEGLEYLHDKCSPAIIHRDVKSNNILLTNKLVAKVADFGLSKVRTVDQEDATHITTVVKGTPGYLDPEYHETGMLTEKSDVYAYGIVLMEILTGRHQISIVQTVSDAQKSNRLQAVADENLGVDYNQDEFAKLVELSLWCVRRSNLERPFMRQVVQRLREIGLASHPSMRRDGSTAESANRVAAEPLSAWSTCHIVSEACRDPENACDNTACDVTDDSLKRPIMHSYRTALASFASSPM